MINTIHVTKEALCPGAISPFHYGQFVEYLCDLIPSMWAEKLYDNSFEGLRPYEFVHLKETDFKEKPWYPSGATNRALCTLDGATKVSGDVSQRIEATGNSPCTVGISQDGLAVDPADPCAFSCHMRQQDIAGPVAVRVHREGRVLASFEFRPTGEWRKFQARLVFSALTADATISISFRGPGRLWLDNASLMPESAVGGWRRDVVEAVRNAKPGIIRFGGSTLDDPNRGVFDWRAAIGDPDRRRPFQAWGGLQPTGPGLEEIIHFCRLVGAEPLICVRFERNTPENAADQVEYFNGPADSPMGALRARNGRPEPHRVRYWQVGNERGGKAYEEHVAAFCEAMHKVDPSIVLLASYPSEAVVRNARDCVGYICPHHYSSDFAAMAKSLADSRRLIREQGGLKALKVGITEWNSTAGDEGPRRAMLWTLENGLHCARYHNFLHRNCDLVEIANRSNLINSFCSGFLQANRHRLYKTPAYYVQQLYATRSGSRPMRLRDDSPGLDISATLSEDRRRLVLFVVNASLNDATWEMDFSAFGHAGQEIKTWLVADREKAGEPDVANSFADPERVASRPGTLRVSSPRFECLFPALSLTVLEWIVQR